MPKIHIKNFKLESDHEAWIASDDFKLHYVSLVQETKNVHYDPKVKNPTAVTLDESSIAITTSKTRQLTATVLPEDAGNKNVTWSSSDEEVATVDENGLVTAVGDGDAVITVTTTVGGLTAQCSVNVTSVVGTVIKYTADTKLNVDLEAFLPFATAETFDNGEGEIQFGMITEPISITDEVFAGRSQLKYIQLVNTVEDIGLNTFKDCTSLETISIPNSVKTIGTTCFDGCTSLQSITLEGNVPPSIADNSFDNTGDCPIYVPSISVNDYKTAPNWYNYVDRITGYL